jgi:hypothetical protein
MELVAWLAGEPHSDEPDTACPVLTVLVRAANDLIPDARRDRLLRPLAPRLVRSRVDDPAVAATRAWIAADAAGRFFAAVRLARLGRADEADLLRALPRIDGPASARLATEVLTGLGPAVRCACWTLRVAADDAPPRVWLLGVVHAIRDADAWGTLPRLVEDVRSCRVAVR